MGTDYNSKIYRPPIVMKVVINDFKDIPIDLDCLNAAYVRVLCYIIAQYLPKYIIIICTYTYIDI